VVGGRFVSRPRAFLEFPTMPKPTPGRVVQFFPLADDLPTGDGQTLSATICHVNADGSVNLSVLGVDGQTHARLKVPLCAEGDALRETIEAPFAVWPQIPSTNDLSKKVRELELSIADLGSQVVTLRSIVGELNAAERFDQLERRIAEVLVGVHPQRIGTVRIDADSIDLFYRLDTGLGVSRLVDACAVFVLQPDGGVARLLPAVSISINDSEV